MPEFWNRPKLEPTNCSYFSEAQDTNTNSNPSTMRTNLLHIIIITVALAVPTRAFVISKALNPPAPFLTRPTRLYESSDSEDGLSDPEQTVYGILQDLHDSDYPFRLVVVPKIIS